MAYDQKSFALSYAKDIVVAMVSKGNITLSSDFCSEASEATRFIADEFMKWLEAPSLMDRVRNALQQSGLTEYVKQKGYTETQVRLLLEDVGFDIGQFVRKLKEEKDVK